MPTAQSSSRGRSRRAGYDGMPPPSTSVTVGFVIPAMSSAMASPASMSPPTVLSRSSTPSTSSDCSSPASSGRTCSYFVVFVPCGAAQWPSIWPMMVRQWIVPRLLRTTVEPMSTSSCFGASAGCSSAPVFVGFVSSYIGVLLFAFGLACAACAGIIRPPAGTFLSSAKDWNLL